MFMQPLHITVATNTTVNIITLFPMNDRAIYLII